MLNIIYNNKVIKNKFFIILFFIVPVLFFSFLNVAYGANPGVIPSSTDCSENTSCAFLDSDSSSINFGCDGCNVSVTNTGLTGYAFGENIGWINLAPTNGGVTNTVQGILGGNAFGENTGWVNFDPDNGGVTISISGTTVGQFDGWAWSQNYGWIKFDCGTVGACVTTDWRVGGGSTPTAAACSDGIENDIPSDGLIDSADPGCHYNYDLNDTYNESDQSETDPDVCWDMPGIQETMPDNYGPDLSHLGWCTPLFLTVDIINPISVDGNAGSYFSADMTDAEIASSDHGPDSTSPFTRADFKIQAKVIGTPETVEFFENGILIGSLADGFVTLVSDTTDIYEIAWKKEVECGSSQTFTITAKVGKDLGTITNISDPVVIIVGNLACVTSATECSDGKDNDGDEGTPGGGTDAEDSGCYTFDQNGEYVYDQNLDNENPLVNICNDTPQPLVCIENPCETNFIFGCPGFCEANPDDSQCIVPIVLPTCFDDPSLCTCADDPSLPGCEVETDASTLENSGSSVIDGIFFPAVVEQINLGLKIAATASVAVGAVISLATALFLNPLSAPELVLIPVRLWSLFLTALGIKKRRKPWGTVYDSITKQPLDPVYVSLRNLEGAEIASSITDIDGRYGFLVKPGVYKVVPRKTNYLFPSDKLSKNFRDEFYANLYFGDYINISDEGEIIVKNIPMDPVNFDWNEFEKNKKSLFKFYSRRELLIAKISNWLFGFGFIIAGTALIVSPEKYNIIIFGVYVLMFILRKTSFKLKAKGRLIDKDGSPLSFASIRAYAVDTNVEIAHQASDEMGRYHILLPNGTYYVKIEKKNKDGSYSVVYTSNYFKVVHGVLNSVFNI
ncbi:MAG: carboxypeptidase-like regulatory domain-containing protein [Candidatus Paceibacterota bacterium]|jgi:hypothetical protein